MSNNLRMFLIILCFVLIFTFFVWLIGYQIYTKILKKKKFNLGLYVVVITIIAATENIVNVVLQLTK